ncbi:MAG: hypothetical protein AAGK74_09160, partial [Chloroflexota bacterium]
DSATAICYVYISPSDSNSWGDDRLGNREIVRAGTDRTWDLPAGIYDVLLQDCDGNTLDDIRSVDVAGAEAVTFVK